MQSSDIPESQDMFVIINHMQSKNITSHTSVKFHSQMQQLTWSGRKNNSSKTFIM